MWQDDTFENGWSFAAAAVCLPMPGDFVHETCSTWATTQRLMASSETPDLLILFPLNRILWVTFKFCHIQSLNPKNGSKQINENRSAWMQQTISFMFCDLILVCWLKFEWYILRPASLGCCWVVFLPKFSWFKKLHWFSSASSVFCHASSLVWMPWTTYSMHTLCDMTLNSKSTKFLSSPWPHDLCDGG